MVFFNGIAARGQYPLSPLNERGHEKRSVYWQSRWIRSIPTAYSSTYAILVRGVNPINSDSKLSRTLALIPRYGRDILRVHVRIQHIIQHCAYTFSVYSTHTYILYIRPRIHYICIWWITSSLFAEFRYNVTCGWLSFVGLSMFDVDCYCWLLGV